MAYLQLRRRYEGRFPDETIFMAASGAVDAMVYLVVTHQISEKQILALAVAAGNEADHLVEFVVNLESLLLSVDSPSIPASEVLKACRDQRGPIGRTVSEVLLAGVVKDDVANAVDLFMQDRKFRGIRNHLSISKR